MLLPSSHRMVLLLAVALGYVPGAGAQKVTHDVSYTTDTAGTQMADLYEPVGDGPFPAIVYLHGGSWRSGGKGSFSRLASDLAGAGYVGLAINYDLRPHSWPLSLEESRAAVKFVRAHAAEYHVDVSRIVVLGTSAGGELAALVALKQQQDSAVAAAVILNGVFDLHSSAHVITRYLGGKCVDLGTVCDDASPLTQVHSGAPPFFVGHGTEDHVVGYGEAQVFVAALRKSDVAVTTYDASGGPHMYWEKSKFYAENLEAVKTFLSLHLRSRVE